MQTVPLTMDVSIALKALYTGLRGLLMCILPKASDTISIMQKTKNENIFSNSYDDCQILEVPNYQLTCSTFMTT